MTSKEIPASIAVGILNGAFFYLAARRFDIGKFLPQSSRTVPKEPMFTPQQTARFTRMKEEYEQNKPEVTIIWQIDGRQGLRKIS